MSGASAAPSPTAPSVFLSYASENRAVVRQIRDALTAAGIEAWYDENELTGGDAWDQKIRRQIRDCTYFMPVISAASNARLEGYFRREWRLAIERSLDMADDLVFLLPVVIDDTSDAGARVPEKFLTVQWLRLPGGAPTPGFQELARRLAAGGDQRLHLARPASRAASSTPRPPQYLPPLDHDPGPPKEWWRVLPYFWAKLPRFVRLGLWCIFLVGAMSLCSRLTKDNRSDDAPRNRRPVGNNPAPADDGKAIAQSVQEALQSVRSARAGINAVRRAPDLDLLAFTGTEQAEKIQQDLFARLVTTSGVKTRLNVSSKGAADTVTPIERAKVDGARFALSATPEKPADGSTVLRVKLEQVADGVQVWTTDVKADESPATASANIYAGILPFLLKKDLNAAK